MRLSYTNTTITSFGGIDGDIQVVVGATTRTVLVDAQGAERGTDGVLRHNHGVVRLTYDAVSELRDFLDHLDEPADPRQHALWSEATYTKPVRRRVHGRRPRRVAA